MDLIRRGKPGRLLLEGPFDEHQEQFLLALINSRMPILYALRQTLVRRSSWRFFPQNLTGD